MPMQRKCKDMQDRLVESALLKSICYYIRTPFMLDSYSHEWEDMCRVANAHATEMDTLRSSNRILTAQV